jgi:hypothetical protein
MLATMPCTAFPGRAQHEFDTFLTHDFPGSAGEYVYSRILRKGPEKRLPVSTVEGEWERERERGVEIVVVGVRSE